MLSVTTAGNHPIVQFFGDLGRLMLITFGVITTVAPQVLGTAFGLAFGYAIIPALVSGSLLASHTLLGLPIVVRLGAIGLVPVVVSSPPKFNPDALTVGLRRPRH